MRNCHGINNLLQKLLNELHEHGLNKYQTSIKHTLSASTATALVNKLLFFGPGYTQFVIFLRELSGNPRKYRDFLPNWAPQFVNQWFVIQCYCCTSYIKGSQENTKKLISLNISWIAYPTASHKLQHTASQVSSRLYFYNYSQFSSVLRSKSFWTGLLKPVASTAERYEGPNGTDYRPGNTHDRLTADPFDPQRVKSKTRPTSTILSKKV